MADKIHGLTQFADIIPENFAPSVEGFFRSDLRLLNSVYDASAWSTGGGSITYPIPTLLPTTTKTTETVLNSSEHVGMTDPDNKCTINLTTQYAIPLVFEVIALKQVFENPQLMMNYSENGGYALRKAFESLVATTIQSATTNDVNAGTNNTLTWAEVLTAWGVFGELNVAPYMTFLGMSGTTWGNSVSSWGVNYTSASDRGDNQNFLATGEWGYLGKTPVHVLPDWDDTSSAGVECASMWVKNAVGYAIQGGVDILGPSPNHEHVGYDLTLAMNGGATLAVNAFVRNFNNT